MTLSARPRRNAKVLPTDQAPIEIQALCWLHAGISPGGFGESQALCCRRYSVQPGSLSIFFSLPLKAPTSTVLTSVNIAGRRVGSSATSATHEVQNADDRH